jgi:hypothetical protein
MKRPNIRRGDSAGLQVGDYVRIQPHGSHKHFGRGIIVGIDQRCAFVHPFQRHRHVERIPLSDLRPWKSANEQYEQLVAKRSGE